jgi:arylsulfatase A-like enzyme
MPRNRTMIFRAALFLGFALSIPFGTCAEPGQRPNILFFLVDDMGVTDTSVRFLRDAEGRPIEAPLNARYHTPNLERLAANGRLFTNARAYPICSPTRASMMTGQAAERLRITTWTHPKRSIDTGEVRTGDLRGPDWRVTGLDPAVPTLPRLLRAAGYRTLHSGKAHFGPDDTPAGDPTNLGFDVNIAGYGGGGPGSYWGEKNFSAAWRNGGHDWDVPHLENYHGTDTFLTEALTVEMNRAITAAVAAGRPFFAHMSHYAVHAPFETDARFAGNYPDLEGMPLAFATLIEGMDQSLGDLIAHLEHLRVAETTLVIFYSDNGSDGPPNLPLRGKKGTRFEGGARVPMIVAWAKSDPKHPLQQALPIPPGSESDTFVVPADFLPTLAAIAGVDIPDDLVLDGHDLRAAFTAQPGPARPSEFLVHFPHGRHNNTLYTTWTDGNWKLIYQYAPREWQLVNLRADPAEQHNRIEQHPDIALAMARRMLELLEARGALFPVDPTTGLPVQPDLACFEAKAAAIAP